MTVCHVTEGGERRAQWGATTHGGVQRGERGRWFKLTAESTRIGAVLGAQRALSLGDPEAGARAVHLEWQAAAVALVRCGERDTRVRARASSAPPHWGAWLQRRRQVQVTVCHVTEGGERRVQ